MKYSGSSNLISLMREAKMKKDPTGDLPLSRAFARCQSVYLFEQCTQFPIMLSELYPRLFAYIYGRTYSLKRKQWLPLNQLL